MQMSRVLGTAFSLLLILAMVVFLGCEGDQGPQGPDGSQGPAGEDGRDASDDPPGDMVFGLSVTNNSSYVHAGAHVINLTFDQSATPSSGTVVCYKMDKPPIIDGEDKGVEDWGSEFLDRGSTIDLEVIRDYAHYTNRTDEARIRAGYDDDYIYFMVQWNEVAVDSVVANGDWTPERWRFDSTGTWVHANIDEDQLYLFWDISGVGGWATSGSELVYNDTDSMLYLDTPGKVDVWHWKAGRSGLLGFFDDEYINSEPVIHYDQGTAAYVYNDLNGLPEFMHRAGPGNSGLPPLHFYDAVPFDEEAGWTEGISSIPGYISVPPVNNNPSH